MIQTEVLALWGAVTGTIGTLAGLLGLWLRFRQHGLNKPKLKCESSFGYDGPKTPKHKITVRAVGRRPVSIDYIKYFILPRTWRQRATKYFQHKKGRWIWRQHPKSAVKLNEGEKSEFFISLHESLCITEIYKVEVVDQTGHSWPVKWVSQKRLKSIATHEVLDEYNDENEKRIVGVTGYRVGERFYIGTSFNTKPVRTGKTCGRGFWFLDEEKYKEKLHDVIDYQAHRFLSGETEEII
ncbi:RING-type E3 ubiquitin transferase [Halomonas sp. NYA30]